MDTRALADHLVRCGLGPCTCPKDRQYNHGAQPIQAHRAPPPSPDRTPPIRGRDHFELLGIVLVLGLAALGKVARGLYWVDQAERLVGAFHFIATVSAESCARESGHAL